jgi:urease alpha subunit
MKLTSKESNALIATAASLTTAITNLTNVIKPAGTMAHHVECGPQIIALQAAMNAVNNSIPTETSGGTGASATTVAGAKTFRDAVNAGYDEL